MLHLVLLSHSECWNFIRSWIVQAATITRTTCLFRVWLETVTLLVFGVGRELRHLFSPSLSASDVGWESDSCSFHVSADYWFCRAGLVEHHCAFTFLKLKMNIFLKRTLFSYHTFICLCVDWNKWPRQSFFKNVSRINCGFDRLLHFRNIIPVHHFLLVPSTKKKKSQSISKLVI